MINAATKRLLNDYLDGEIGLADKAELERLLTDDPSLLEEYKALRQIGLQLSQIPQIRPHPLRLRMKVQEALEAQSRVFLTPQRVFAGAMAVSLVVIALSFGMLVFQQRMLGRPIDVPSVPQEAAPVVPEPGASIAMLDVPADGNRFFSRMLMQHELGMIGADVLGTITAQTRVFEGAVCTNETLNQVRLAYPVRALQLRTTPSVAQQLSMLAEEVSGQPSPISVSNMSGQSVTLEQYLRDHPSERAVNLLLRFQ